MQPIDSVQILKIVEKIKKILHSLSRKFRKGVGRNFSD